MSKRVSDFAVIEKMFNQNMDAKACFDSNIIRSKFSAGKGGEITIGVSSDIALAAEGRYMMACYFVNTKEFFKVKEQMEAELKIEEQDQ